MTAVGERQVITLLTEIRNMLRTLTEQSEGGRIVRRFGPDQGLLWVEREERSPP